jgi:chemotaxis protein MotB
MGGKNPFCNGEPEPPAADPPVPIQPPAAPASQPVRRVRWGSVLGTVLLLVAASAAAGLGYLHEQQRRTLETQGAMLAEGHRRNRLLIEARSTLETQRDATAVRLTKTQADAKRLQAEVRRLEEEQRTITEAQRRLETEMRTALESRDVTISELAGKLTVNILDRVLFASGEADITAEGQAVLRKVADVLGQFSDRQVQVIGHTDNVPIRTARFPSNWELSAARAIAAVRFLSEEAGVDPRRLGALGYGEFHPVADNATPEGRAQNRRIAIVILPELLQVATEAHLKAEPIGLPPPKTSPGSPTEAPASTEPPTAP